MKYYTEGTAKFHRCEGCHGNYSLLGSLMIRGVRALNVALVLIDFLPLLKRSHLEPNFITITYSLSKHILNEFVFLFHLHIENIFTLYIDELPKAIFGLKSAFV